MSTSTNGTCPENDNSDVVHLNSEFDVNGLSSTHTVLTADNDKRCKEVHCDPRTPIPVIFLPGVMGSLLCDQETGEELWYPPNMDAVLSGTAGVVSVIGGYFASATKRATRFDPQRAIVDPRGPIIELDSKEFGFDEKEARRRGWSTVHRWSYQPTLAWLQETLNKPMLSGEPLGEWSHGDHEGKKAALKAVLDTHPQDYGGYGQGEAIASGSDAFKSFCEFRYPVYAIGYNFLQSNQISGRDVLDGIDFKDIQENKVTRILGIRDICRENGSDKAIIITHSMGGIVARMACQLCGGADSIYGVVHGAQPATGAPLFAKRFRTGGEGNNIKERLTNKSLLGRDDAEFVAIASNAEGPMELSPMPDYHEGAPWWIFVDKAGKERMALPQQSALEELYTCDEWYGLLPDPSLLDPAGIVNQMLENSGKQISVHDQYKRTMDAVVTRQAKLFNNYHDNTYALYGDGSLETKRTAAMPATSKQEISLPESDLQTWGRVVWQGDIPEDVTEAELKAAELVSDSHHGDLVISVRGQTVKLSVQHQAVAPEPGDADNGIIPGDGTVPVWSAAAQGRGIVPGSSGDKAAGVQMAFVQGGYEHQFCFNHPWTRWATLYSVTQIAQTIGVSAA